MQQIVQAILAVVDNGSLQRLQRHRRKTKHAKHDEQGLHTSH
jgi:hypothetical protein